MAFAFRIVKTVEVLLVKVCQCSSCKECVINDVSDGDDDDDDGMKDKEEELCIGLSTESHISGQHEVFYFNEVIIHNLMGCVYTQK